MQTTRENIVGGLQRAGLWDEAERAQRSLPESGEFEEMVRLCEADGISRGMLMDLLGGSP
jgi:hypothetical protein